MARTTTRIAAPLPRSPPTFDLIDIYIFAPNEFQESIKHIYNQDIWGPIYTRNDILKISTSTRCKLLVVGAL